LWCEDENVKKIIENNYNSKYIYLLFTWDYEKIKKYISKKWILEKYKILSDYNWYYELITWVYYKCYP